MNVPLELSLIVPAYNEVRSIGTTLRSMQGFLDRRRIAYEIIVAADGNDGTRELVGELAGGDERFRVLGHVQRRGKGRGIRDGVRLARGRIVGFADADNKTPIDELDRVLSWFDEGYDIVIGSRATADSQIEVAQPLHRRLGSRLFGLGMHLLLGMWHVRDTQCGFKFFRYEVARDWFGRQRIDGYMFDAEVLAQFPRYSHHPLEACPFVHSARPCASKTRARHRAAASRRTFKQQYRRLIHSHGVQRIGASATNPTETTSSLVHRCFRFAG
jgi:glycosyltransferase involved in cell wall biosynthesis